MHLKKEKKLIANEKEKEVNISNLMIGAAQNGASNDVLNKIMKSKTMGEAIINSGQYIKEQTTGTWDTFKDEFSGETKLVNKITGEVKNVSQSSTNLGSQVGEIMGLPSFDTRSENPGVNRSDRNNNPGNIKVSENTKTWEGVIGVK